MSSSSVLSPPVPSKNHSTLFQELCMFYAVSLSLAPLRTILLQGITSGETHESFQRGLVPIHLWILVIKAQAISIAFEILS